MKKTMLAIFAALAICIPAMASDEELCMDCHEPAEDWEGMSAEEVVEVASDTSIKRHADNAEFSEEQLKAIVATLLGE
jgi:RNA polymerase subunit RPABC4/transcription elongation factor Spt4